MGRIAFKTSRALAEQYTSRFGGRYSLILASMTATEVGTFVPHSMSVADYGIKLYLSIKELQTGVFVKLSRERDYVRPIYHDFLAFFEMIEAHPYHGPRITGLFMSQFLEFWYVCGACLRLITHFH